LVYFYARLAHVLTPAILIHDADRWLWFQFATIDRDFAPVRGTQAAPGAMGPLFPPDLRVLRVLSDFKNGAKPSGPGLDHRAWCQRLEIFGASKFRGRSCAYAVPVTPDGTTERCRRYAYVRDGYPAQS
jgi:hypothetical protein